MSEMKTKYLQMNLENKISIVMTSVRKLFYNNLSIQSDEKKWNRKFLVMHSHLKILNNCFWKFLLGKMSSKFSDDCAFVPQILNSIFLINLHWWQIVRDRMKVSWSPIISDHSRSWGEHGSFFSEYSTHDGE